MASYTKYPEIMTYLSRQSTKGVQEPNALDYTVPGKAVQEDLVSVDTLHPRNGRPSMWMCPVFLDLSVGLIQALLKPKEVLCRRK